MTAFMRTAFLAGLLSLLSACSSFLPQGGQDGLQRQLADVTHWQVRGKLAVTTAQDSHSGYLNWQQQNDAYDLFISGPFGASASRLQGDQQFAQLSLPGQEAPLRAPTAEQLMQTHLGWNFPVSDIRYWVKGQPSPKSSAKSQFNDHGLLSELHQHGWQVRYSRYQRVGDYWLPGLIRMEGHGFRFTFAIKDWELHD